MIFTSKIEIEAGPVITYLCRESKSLSILTRDSVETLILRLLDPVKKFSSIKSVPRRFVSLNHQLTLKFMDSTPNIIKDIPQEELIKMGEKWFKSFADFL